METHTTGTVVTTTVCPTTVLLSHGTELAAWPVAVAVLFLPVDCVRRLTPPGTDRTAHAQSDSAVLLQVQAPLLLPPPLLPRLLLQHLLLLLHLPLRLSLLLSRRPCLFLYPLQCPLRPPSQSLRPFLFQHPLLGHLLLPHHLLPRRAMLRTAHSHTAIGRIMRMTSMMRWMIPMITSSVSQPAAIPIEIPSTG